MSLIPGGCYGQLTSRLNLIGVGINISVLFLIFLSPLETISTSLWAGLRHHFQVLSVFSHASYQFVFVHMFSVVVDPSQSRLPLLLSILFLDMLSSSLILICMYQFIRFCLRNVDICYTLAYSCIIWFLTWAFLFYPFLKGQL